MGTLIGFVVVTALAALFALCSANFARCPPPQLAFAHAAATSYCHGYAEDGDCADEDDGRKSRHNRDGTGLLNCFRTVAAYPVNNAKSMRDLSCPGLLPIYPVRMIKKEPSLPVYATQESGSEEDDGCEMRPSEAQVREQVYSDCLDSFDACKGRDMALVLKIDLLSRYPGYRSSIRRAFRAIYG